MGFIFGRILASEVWRWRGEGLDSECNSNWATVRGTEKRSILPSLQAPKPFQFFQQLCLLDSGLFIFIQRPVRDGNALVQSVQSTVCFSLLWLQFVSMVDLQCCNRSCQRCQHSSAIGANQNGESNTLGGRDVYNPGLAMKMEVSTLWKNSTILYMRKCRIV